MKRNTLNKLAALIIVLVMALPQFAFAADNIGKLGNTIALYIGSNKAIVNNVEKVIDASNSSITPIIVGDRTFVPIRFVSENMGMKVGWNNATQGIIITNGSNNIQMQVNNKSMSRNGVAFTSDAAPFIKNDKTYVPLRIISEKFGKNVFFYKNLIIISEKTNVFSSTTDKTIVDSLLMKYQTPKKLTVEEISKQDKSVVVINVLDSNGKVIALGSGFCIAPGVFVTNYHVAKDAAKLQIQTEDNTKYDVEGLISADSLTDLVLLKTKVNPNIPSLKLGFDKQNAKGQQIVTIGNPEGLTNTVSEGIISGFRNDSGVELIQITAPITHGSSGSPLFDMYGDVIGVNTSGLDTGNLNFAVSINHIYEWYNRISGLAFGSVPIMGKENYTKDAKILDSEILNMVNSVAKAYNSENLDAYVNMFYYNNDTEKKTDTQMIQTLFDQFDIRMKIINPIIIKKTTNETLVRVAASYIEESVGNRYADNNEQFLFYLAKIGGQWKIYKIDIEKVTYTEAAAPGSGTTNNTEQGTETPTTTTPGTSSTSSPAVDLKGINVSMAINSFKYNKSNNKIYALNKANKKLIVIDAGTKTVEKTVSLKYKPSDLAVSSDNSMLYIVNEGSNNILEMNLSDYTIKREMLWDAPSYGNDAVHYHVEYYNNKLFLIDGKWAPSLWVLDLSSGKLTDLGQNTNSSDIAKDKIDNVGDLVIDEENGSLYFWQQYGWSAGYAGSNVLRYEIGDASVNQIDNAGLSYPSYQRDPLDTPIMLIKQKSWVISKNYVLNMNNLKQKIYQFDEPLYAIDYNGKYAVSKKNIYDMDSFDKIDAAPLQNADFYFFDSAGTLYMVDNKSSSIKYYTIK